MLATAAPPAALYSGCAFGDAAAMAATVTRLEAELAHAKAALADRHASEEELQRQKRALEADVARLHAEVSLPLHSAACMFAHPCICLSVHPSIHHVCFTRSHVC